MTQEELFSSFLKDPIIRERLSEEQFIKIKNNETVNHRLVECIKMAIDGCIQDESEPTISRKINLFLNR